MAVAVTNKLATGSTSTATSYATASVTLTTGRMYLLTVNSHKATAGTANTPTVTGASATWTQVGTHSYSADTTRKTTLFRCISAAGGSGALTIDFGGQNQDSAAWILDEFTGMTPGNNGGTALIQSVDDEATGSPTSFTLTLSAFGNSGNATYGAIAAGSAAAPVSPGSGFTEKSEDATSGPVLESEFKATADTTVDWTFSSAHVWGAFAVELQVEPVTPAATAASGTGAASNAKTTIKPPASAATGTGAAYNAQVSYLPPPRTVLINSVDYTSTIRLDSFSFTECANNGEVGIGGFDVYDDVSALDVPALKAVQFDEPQAGQSNKRTFTGFTHERATSRGVQKAAGVREWGVEVTDLNTLFDDYVLTAADSADRGSETDYARMVWLLTTSLGTVGLVGSGVVPNSNTVTMPAQDYRGRKARDVASECLAASGKLCFIYDYGSGRKLYYDVATGTSLSSTAKISDVATDIDSSTVWATTPPQVKRSPDRIFSKVHLTWTGGTTTVSNATTASTYRTREASVQDMSITTSAAATVLANSLLTAAAAELLEVSGVSIAMPAANVNDIRAGQRVQIKLTRHGISSYTYYRVTRRTVAPLGEQGVSDVMYRVTLQLASDVLPSANGGRGADDIPQNRSNANDDGATVIIDRGGITITDGALTITDEFLSTVMTAGAFSGSWSDFVRLGLYNARLQYALVGSIQAGRTSDLPYWTVTKTGAGVLTGLSGGGVKATWGAASDNVYIDADAVPVQSGGVVEVAFALLMNRAAGTLTAQGAIYWYKYDGSASSTPVTNVPSYGGTASVTSLLWVRSAAIVPNDATTAKFTVGMSESSHNAANSISIYAMKMQDVPVQVMPYATVADGATVELHPGSGTVNDYDLGAGTALATLIPSGALTVTGLVAPTDSKWRLTYFINYNASFAITLKNENVGSAAGNRLSLPSGVDFVLPVFGAALLVYNSTSSRWQVIAKS